MIPEPLSRKRPAALRIPALDDDEVRVPIRVEPPAVIEAKAASLWAYHS